MKPPAKPPLKTGLKPAVKKPAVRVTDHAIVRYLERVGGFDIDGLRRQIEARLQAAADVGADTVIIDGARFCLQYNEGRPILATVLEADQRGKLYAGHAEG
jgi:hypothetical protein